VNIATPVHVRFAVVPELNEEVIITPPVHELLKQVTEFDMPVITVIDNEVQTVVQNTESVPPTGERTVVTYDESLPLFYDVEAGYTSASSTDDCKLQSTDRIN
jgi:hypothetical protein